MFMKFIISVFKIILLGFFALIILGRLFFPNLVQDYVISSTEKIPVLGQVLGITWDKSSEIMPLITQKTVKIADQVESADLGIDEAIENAAGQENISQTIKTIINKSIESKVSQLRGMPGEVITRTQEEIKKEVYKQICSNWNEASFAASPK